MEGAFLIVDDSRVMRAMIVRILALSGLPCGSVREAADGQEALRLVEEARPDVVLLDVNMPVMDGVEFLARFRVLPGCAAIPVVVVSTESGEQRIRRLRLLGATFLHKPFKPEHLAETIRRATATAGGGAA